MISHFLISKYKSNDIWFHDLEIYIEWKNISNDDRASREGGNSIFNFYNRISK